MGNMAGCFPFIYKGQDVNRNMRSDRGGARKVHYFPGKLKNAILSEAISAADNRIH